MPLEALASVGLTQEGIQKDLRLVGFKHKHNRLEGVIKELQIYNQRFRKTINQLGFLSKIAAKSYLVKISPSIEKLQKIKRFPMTTYKASDLGLVNVCRIASFKVNVWYVN